MMRRRTLGIGLLLGAMGCSAAPAQVSLPRLLAWEETVKGPEDTGLRAPVDLAVTPDGRMAVADAHGARILFFSDPGVGWQLDQVLDLPAPPLSLAHDGERFLLSLRAEPHLVALEGERHQLRIVPLPEKAVPGRLAPLPGGGFLIPDFRSDRLLELGAEGGIRLRCDLEPGTTAVVATPSGGHAALLPALGEVRTYDSRGSEIARWPIPGVGPVPAWPAGILVERLGGVIVVDRHGSRLLVLDRAGRPIGIGSRRGWGRGLLLFPGDVDALPDGSIAVVDQGNGRVQIFRRLEEAAGQ